MTIKKMLLAGLTAVFLVATGPVRGQQVNEPRAVSASDVLIQLNSLFVLDMTKRVPAEETLRLTKSVVRLNELQIEAMESAESKTIVAPAFQNLRADVCQQRPYIRLLDLDGRVKLCKGD